MLENRNENENKCYKLVGNFESELPYRFKSVKIQGTLHTQLASGTWVDINIINQGDDLLATLQIDDFGNINVDNIYDFPSGSSYTRNHNIALTITELNDDKVAINIVKPILCTITFENSQGEIITFRKKHRCLLTAI
jgi:hypothetical protein